MEHYGKEAQERLVLSTVIELLAKVSLDIKGNWAGLKDVSSTQGQV